jgi:uncharacterized protein YkwD
VLAGAALSWPGAASASEDGGSVLAALNRVRTDPAGFAVVLEQYRTRLQGNRYLQPGTRNSWIVTQEGAAAVDEAIAVLRATRPLPPFTVDAGLALAALDHVAWQGPRGEVGHAGDGRSSPFDRMRRHGVAHRSMGENISYGADGLQIVVDLIVDDGVPDRGHRRNILNPIYREVGIAVGPHRRYGTMCVMDFASAQ